MLSGARPENGKWVIPNELGNDERRGTKAKQNKRSKKHAENKNLSEKFELVSIQSRLGGIVLYHLSGVAFRRRRKACE
jgi:hypothetical protein